jgi:hypothetical protein
MLDERSPAWQYRDLMKALFCLSVVFAFPSAHAAEPTVSLAGIEVVMDDGGKDFDGFKTFNMSQGHHVALIVRSKGKAIIGFDEDKAAITLGGINSNPS